MGIFPHNEAERNRAAGNGKHQISFPAIQEEADAFHRKHISQRHGGGTCKDADDGYRHETGQSLNNRLFSAEIDIESDISAGNNDIQVSQLRNNLFRSLEGDKVLPRGEGFRKGDMEK